MSNDLNKIIEETAFGDTFKPHPEKERENYIDEDTVYDRYRSDLLGMILSRAKRKEHIQGHIHILERVLSFLDAHIDDLDDLWEEEHE